MDMPGSLATALAFTRRTVTSPGFGPSPERLGGWIGYSQSWLRAGTDRWIGSCAGAASGLATARPHFRASVRPPRLRRSP